MKTSSFKVLKPYKFYKAQELEKIVSITHKSSKYD